MNHCTRCEHEWMPRQDQPALQCPRCKSPRWQQPMTVTAAHSRVAVAIKHGKLAALDGSVVCVDCGEPAACYDHRDYAKPLQVEPVCDKCNGKRGPGLNRVETGFAIRPVRLTLQEYAHIKRLAMLAKQSVAQYTAELMRDALTRNGLGS